MRSTKVRRWMYPGANLHAVGTGHRDVPHVICVDQVCSEHMVDCLRSILWIEAKLLHGVADVFYCEVALDPICPTRFRDDAR